MNCYICSNEIGLNDLYAKCSKCDITYVLSGFPKRLLLIPHTLVINNITVYLNIGVISYSIGYAYIKSGNLPDYIRNNNYFDSNTHLTEDEVKTYINNIYRYIDNLIFT